MSLETTYLNMVQRYHTVLYKIETLLDRPSIPFDANIEARGESICDAIKELKEKASHGNQP